MIWLSASRAEGQANTIGAKCHHLGQNIDARTAVVAEHVVVGLVIPMPDLSVLGISRAASVALSFFQKLAPIFLSERDISARFSMSPWSSDYIISDIASELGV